MSSLPQFNAPYAADDSTIVAQLLADPAIDQAGQARIDATATVTGCTPQRYDWNFGTDAETPTLTTTGNSASAIYNNGGTKTVTVTVRCTDGRTTQTSSQRTLQTTP